MRPHLACNDTVYVLRTYAVSLRKNADTGSWSVVVTDGGNLSLRQSGTAVLLAFQGGRRGRRCAAPLGAHVGQVVRRRAQEEGPGVPAEPHVARVADAQAVRDRSVGQLPRHPVGEHEATAGQAELAVARSLRGRPPDPAGVGMAAQHLLPEPLG